MLVFVYSFILCFLLLKVLKPVLMKISLDIPNKRSSHKFSKPTGGGLAFAIIDIILSVVNGNFFKLAFIPLLSVSFLDDVFKISSISRYGFHIFTAMIIVLNSTIYSINNINFQSLFIFLLILKIIYFLFLVFFITAIINFVNFMDGIDGLVAGCILAILIAAISNNVNNLIPLILAAFLVFNWQPAKIFMGDAGSTYLAVVYSDVIFKLPNLSDSISFLMMGIPLLGDALITVLRRLIAGKNIFKAHRDHLYQRLVLAGWQHYQVSLIYIVSTISLAFVYKLFGFLMLLVTSIFILFFGICLDKKYAKKLT